MILMDNLLLQHIDQWLLTHREQIITDLIGLVQIPSVSDEKSPIKPYGQPCRDALQFMFDLAKKHGYESRNYDNYIGEITFNQGDKRVGIWAHLDVVPVEDPSQWVYPPFEGTLVEDRYLIGRGVQDNKAPAIGVFHVMNLLKDLGITLRHQYQLYLGTNEECGMGDARYFIKHYAQPDLSIVPDTGFPVCTAQRGAMTLRLSIPFSTSITFTQHNNPSVTPDLVEALLQRGEKLTARGLSAHIYNAKGINNGIINMLHALSGPCPHDAHVLNSLIALCSSYDGACLNMAYEDTLSGPLMMAPTRMGFENGQLYVDLYLILPVTCDPEILTQAAQAKALSAGADLAVLRLRNPCSFPENHPVVTRLTKLYNDLTQRKDAPFVMSGGNYAAYLKNAFGFGPGLPGREFPPHIFRPGHGDYHQCDESQDIDQLLTFMRIYAMSIITLDQMDDLNS